MLTLSKYIKKLTIMLILSIGILTGCSGSEEPGSEKPGSEKPGSEEPVIEKQGIEIDTSEVEITGEGLELLGVEIEKNGSMNDVAASIKNNSGNKYNMVGVYLKLYDESGSAIDTRPGVGEKIEPGDVFKVKIPFADLKDVSKIKVTEISVPGYKAKNSSNNDTGNNTSTASQDTFEDTVIKCAQTLVYKNIKTPGTAQWVSAEVLEQDKYGRYLVDVVVDAENGFGALIRSGFIVALQSVQEDGKFTHSAMFFMKEYSKDYERERAVKNIRDLNDWNEDPNQLDEENTEPDAG